MSTNLALLNRMKTPLDVLKPGSCEVLKAGVHATALGLVVVMGVYNTAAWFRRRERHLAVNAVLYTALTIWERAHVAHHVAAIRRQREDAEDAAAARVDLPAPTKVAA